MFWFRRKQQQEPSTVEDDVPTVEAWSDANSRVHVERKAGFACSVSMRTKVGLPPDMLFDILTNPRNDIVFRGIQSTRKRRVLSNKHGRKTVEVEQEGKWKVLWFKGSFITKMVVVEDRHHNTIEFRQISPGFMKRFEGKWEVQPFTQATLDEVYDVHHTHPFLGLRKVAASVQQGLGITRPHDSLLTLEQDVLPSRRPPKPLEPLFTAICCKILSNVIRDLQSAACKINKGELQWPPLESVGMD